MTSRITLRRLIACSSCAIALAAVAAADASAQRRGGGGGGGASARMGAASRPATNPSKQPSRDMQMRGSANGNINAHRDVNVNVDRDVNVDVDHHYDYDWGDYYHPVARAATAAAVTAEVIGTYYRTLPANCVTIYRGAIIYYQCGTVWYRPSYYGTSVQYVVVTAP